MLSSEAYNTLLSFRLGPVHRGDGATDMIKYLVEQGFLKETKADVVGELQLRTVEWKITPAGLNALSIYEDHINQTAAQQAKEEAQRKEDRAMQEAQYRAAQRASWAAVAQVIIPIATFIIGLLVEHWVGLADWFLGFFK